MHHTTIAQRPFASRAALPAAIAAVLMLSACQTTDTQRRTAIGTGVGAITGAVIASATGGKAGTGAIAGAALGGIGTYIWSNNMERQRQELEAATRGTGVNVSRTADNQLKLDIPSDISFDSGSANVRPEFQAVLNRFAQGMKTLPNAKVIIVGHTDNSGSAAVNDPLSLHRANATREYVVRQGISAARISTEGRGASQPIADNGTAAGRAKNRRVEIFVAEATQ